MTKEELLKLVNDHKDSYPQIIKARYKEFYQNIINNYIGEKFGEKLYRWIHEGDDYGKCQNCGKETRFQSFIVGFIKYCSKKCSNASTAETRGKAMTHEIPDPKFWIEKNCLMCNINFWSLIKRDGKFCSNKCSTNFTANDKERLRKIRETKLEKYGNETYVNPEKAKETCIERYGVDNASKSLEVIEKIKETNMEKYGVEWSFQSKEIQEKIKETNLERYGTEYSTSHPLVKEKRENTFMKRYGHINPFQIPEIQEKIKKGYMEKYGVEYPTQSEEIRKKIREISRKRNYNQLMDYSKYANKVEILFSENEYFGATQDHKYKVKCKKCGAVFEDHFDGDLHPRCLICYPNIAGFSYAEKEIINYLKSILQENIEIITKNRSILGNRELDIYIPSLNLAIEYNGLFWHSENGGKKDKTYHLDKLDRCNEKGIRLITIFEDEWINKKSVVKSKLFHILKINKTDKIYARKCKLEEISQKLSNVFLDNYHIQGSCDNSGINMGLFFNGELVSVMTFGKLRVALGNVNVKNDEHELLRYATSKHVVGGCGKMLSYFKKKYNPSKIVSYADRRWSDGNLYEKLGFPIKKIVKPTTHYFQPGYAVRYHRFGFRKNVLAKKLELFDPRLTEWENMQLNGWDRIWDCGNLKYEWVK